MPLTLEFTDVQRKHMEEILATHLATLTNESVQAHGVDDRKYEFYRSRAERTAALLALFIVPEPEEEDDEEEEEESDE